MPVKCVVCGLSMPGWPDADVTCADCESMNFAGDALRHPPRRQAHPRPWWEDAILPLPPRRTRVLEAPWSWTPEENA